MPQENAADARAKVRYPANRECVHVERSLLEPSRVVDDERERTETDLAALHQNSAENHDDSGRKRLQLLQQMLKHGPTVGANYRGSKSDSSVGG